MTTAEVANRLVALCREGKNMQAVEELYAPDVVTVESSGSPEMPAEQKGIDAVRAKGQWWYDNHEMHSGSVSGPFVASGDDASKFCVQFAFDVTFKPTGQRMQMSEMALYEVRKGKIVHEHFYYNAPGA